MQTKNNTNIINNACPLIEVKINFFIKGFWIYLCCRIIYLTYLQNNGIENWQQKKN